MPVNDSLNGFGLLRFRKFQIEQTRIEKWAEFFQCLNLQLAHAFFGHAQINGNFAERSGIGPIAIQAEAMHQNLVLAIIQDFGSDVQKLGDNELRIFADGSIRRGFRDLSKNFCGSTGKPLFASLTHPPCAEEVALNGVGRIGAEPKLPGVIEAINSSQKNHAAIAAEFIDIVMGRGEFARNRRDQSQI